MQTEFYRSTPELRQTFSLVIVASLVGIGAHDQVKSPYAALTTHEPVILPACVQNVYYEPVPPRSDPDKQVKALQHFAKVLLANTEDNPQSVEDLLNRHFWELV